MRYRHLLMSFFERWRQITRSAERIIALKLLSLFLEIHSGFYGDIVTMLLLLVIFIGMFSVDLESNVVELS